MPSKFAHLRSHTEFSIVDSSLRVEELIAQAKADGQPAVAMTDINGLFGAIRFYMKARAAGVKPIIGVEAVVEGRSIPAGPGEKEDSKEPDHKVVLLCENEEGYLKLMRLVSRGYVQNMRKGQAMLREEWIAEEGAEGLFCLSGDENGAVGALAARGDLDSASAVASRWAALFPERYYLEVQRRGVPNEAEFVQGVVSVADALGLPLVATHPMQFLQREDYLSHEVKVCDKRKEVFQSRERERSFTPEQHFKTTAQIEEMFSDLPDAVANTMAIAERCNVEIKLGQNALPKFETPNGESPEQFFIERSREGLARRLEKLFPDPAVREEKRPQYEARLQFEMNIIAKMGFEGYFLIVQDFIHWAKAHDIPVGPGRGSGAGSLVAYALTITDLDPLEYNLLFERFLNPERVSMPDFDIDFCKERRELVIDYVTKRYGAEAVAGICNIMTLQAKAALKAAGRALDMPVGQVDGVSKLIPALPPGKEVSLVEVLDNEVPFRERYDADESVRKLVDYAIKIEGLPHGIGKHASGIIIAPGKLTDFTPLYIPEGSTQPVSHYDKDDVEKAGLVKFDFLGLKTLTELDYATKLIQKLEGQENFDLSKIPLDDAEVYEVFQKADTFSVFQFESPGMQRMLKDAKPDRFADLIALVSLYRPGPMDLIPDFINRKHGRQRVEYPDDRVAGVLSETYGIMVYQEQVMQMAQIIGGYSLGGADLLRRAMGKKKPEEMAQHRVMFAEGAAKNGVTPEKAGKIFDTMEKFAGYGFNKSHAAAYALLSYQTAYVKRHFPSAFYASWMTVEGQEDTASIPGMIEDAERHGVKILPPNINTSDVFFTPGIERPEELLYGIAGLKGLGKPAADHIVQTRKAKGQFTDLLDFCKKVGKGFINKRGIEILIKSGAFDTLHPNRAETLAFLPVALKYLDKVSQQEEKIAKESAKAKSALEEVFELEGAPPKPAKKSSKKPAAPKAPKVIEMPPQPEWESLPEQELLTKLQGEKEAFGFYFSDHPFRFYRSQLGDLKACLPLADVLDIPPGWDKHWIAGFVKEMKAIKGRSGKFAIATISDGDTEMEVKLFSEIYETTKDWLKADQFVLFSATIKEDKFRGGIAYQAVAAHNLAEAKGIIADNLNVALPPERLPLLLEMVKDKPGSLPLLVWHPTENASFVRAKDTVLYVGYDEELIKQLGDAFGEKHVKTRYKQAPMPPVKNPPAWKKGR